MIMMLQCDTAYRMPSVGVSSLDLGRTASSRRPFFLFRGLAGLRDGGFQGHRQAIGQARKVGGQPLEPAGALQRALIHVKAAVDLDLHGVDATRRLAVMLGDEAAGVRLV